MDINIKLPSGKVTTFTDISKENKGATNKELFEQADNAAKANTLCKLTLEKITTMESQVESLENSLSSIQAMKQLGVELAIRVTQEVGHLKSELAKVKATYAILLILKNKFDLTQKKLLDTRENSTVMSC